MMQTVATQLHQARHSLQEVAGENASLEARLLAAHAWGMTPEALVRDADAACDADALAALVARRLNREPVAQIVGYKEFWRDRFLVTADVLTPRADSEAMIESLLRLVPEKSTPLRLLDLGTGSGCLLLSALREYEQARGLGVDQSSAALAVAQQNAQQLGLADRAQFLQSDWCAALTGQFDVLLTNPPYIATAEIETLDADVRVHEPYAALDGGADGLIAYRQILSTVTPHLAPGAWVLCEIGATQAADVAAIGTAQGFTYLFTTADLAGLPRIVAFQH